KMTSIPSGILNLGRGTLEAGAPGDVVIFDADAPVKIDRTKFRSKSKNTPFNGWDLKGKVLYTIVGGKVVYSA
ncbi:MAG: amidohydrolase family protein, partial [Candidatus Dadabacteria bacterium]|nr:amidohydrolase family protein [Candidatus Dadabacteria bacterium]